MKLKRLIAASASVAAVALAAVLYTSHAVKSSDHQDTYNLATRSNTSADITDVYVFPAPDNANNVVFAMDVNPLLMPGQSKVFDPTLIWQFKIAHGATNYHEDQVIQMSASGTDTNQTLTLYGPAAPNEVGTTNTLLSTATGSTTFGNSTTSLRNNTISFFGGPKADPFNFDLFAFFTFLGDRNYGTHSGQNDPGAGNTFSNGNSAANIAPLTPAYDKSANPNTPSFNGFANGTMSNTTSGAGTGYACSTNPATNVLAGFNVLSYVVEVPRNLIYGGSSGFSDSVIHVWATVSSSTGS